MVLTIDDPGEMKALQEYLATKFEIKDFGQFFFGEIEVVRLKCNIYLSQRNVLDILIETGMLACKLAETLIEMNHKLVVSIDQILTDKGKYHQLVGQLIF